MYTWESSASIPFVQNLISTFSIWSEFSAKTCFVYMTPCCQIWKYMYMLTSNFCRMFSSIGIWVQSVHSNTFQQEIFVLLEKDREEEKKRKMEKENKEYCTWEGQELKGEIARTCVEGFFSFLFVLFCFVCFHCLNFYNCSGSTKNGKSYPEKSFHTRKNWEKQFCPR